MGAPPPPLSRRDCTISGPSVAEVAEEEEEEEEEVVVVATLVSHWCAS